MGIRRKYLYEETRAKTSSVENPANNQEFAPKPSATRMVGAPTVARTRTTEAMAEEAESVYKPN